MTSNEGSAIDRHEIDRVMIDIETLGTEPGCTILSLGAVRFDEVSVIDTYEGQFYEEIDTESCAEHGLTIDAGTLDWWLHRDDAVQYVLTGGDALETVLQEFAEWYGDADEVWAFSPSFDCDILSAAYDAVGQEVPWSYRDERCARTLASLPVAADVEQDGDAHDALDDAMYQAEMVSRTLARLQEVSADA